MEEYDSTDEYLHERWTNDIETRCTVSGQYRCRTTNAKKLCIYDIENKLRNGGDYDIGGTYDEFKEPDLWFYFSTSACPGYNYLLNLFVCQRKTGPVAISVSNSTDMYRRSQGPRWYLTNKLDMYFFSSSRVNESHFIKTYGFKEEDLKLFDGLELQIPIEIDMKTTKLLGDDIVKQIKWKNDFSHLLSEQETADFILESASHTKYKTHKVILLAHSPVLRSRVEKSKTQTLFLDISDADMELLLEYLYCGTITKAQRQESYSALIKIAHEFQLEKLRDLTHSIMVFKINVNNAVEFVEISEKYALERLHRRVITFIKGNPRVLDKVDWVKMNNPELEEKLQKFNKMAGD